MTGRRRGAAAIVKMPLSALKWRGLLLCPQGQCGETLTRCAHKDKQQQILLRNEREEGRGNRWPKAAEW